MKPKFTDTHRYPTPYVPSGATDIRKAFKRETDRLKAEQAERERKVRKIKDAVK